MKTIELQIKAEPKISHVTYYYAKGNIEVLLFDNDAELSGEPLILMDKKEFVKLLANQKKKPKRKDLPKETKVMVANASKDTSHSHSWRLAIYYGDSRVASSSEGSVSYDHIIPFSLFDPDDPDKWNGTENDYGTEGGAR